MPLVDQLLFLAALSCYNTCSTLYYLALHQVGKLGNELVKTLSSELGRRGLGDPATTTLHVYFTSKE